MKATAETMAWIAAYYDAVDNLDFDRLEGFLHSDCVCRYPGGHVQTGAARILRTFRMSLPALARIRHEIKGVWEEDDQIIFELEVTYWRQDGAVIVRPGMGVFAVADARILEQRLFVDARGVWD